MNKIEKVGAMGGIIGMVFMMIMFSLAFVVMAGQNEVSIFGTNFVRVDAEQEEVNKIGCLTSLDLNRDDLRDVVILSNPCTQFGLPLRLYLQQDEEGNQFGVPVCLFEADS